MAGEHRGWLSRCLHNLQDRIVFHFVPHQKPSVVEGKIRILNAERLLESPEFSEEQGTYDVILSHRLMHHLQDPLGTVVQLHSLLCTLESSWPHLLALAGAKLGDGAARPWVPAEPKEGAIDKAYKKATLHLHPDRVSKRDLSVRVEAEEVLKVLTLAHADKPRWLRDPPRSRSASSKSATSRRGPLDGRAPRPPGGALPTRRGRA